jgi:hypothetical protein
MVPSVLLVGGLGVEQALGTFDEVRAMIWRLVNPR